ncbi:MAG: YlqD family protein [Bacillota bacterium]
MGITVLRNVTVKVIVTEDFKSRLASEMQEAARRLEAEASSLEAQAKKARSEDSASLLSEAAQRLERRQRLLDQLKDVAKLALGAEVTQGAVQGTAEVVPGDVWAQVGEAEVVLRDGVVVEIRERRC